MNLIFIWIEKYKKIENFQTNFGSNYNIEFKNGHININSNKNFINDFFEINKSDIDIQMSAIVGENGTGKSTILDFIMEYVKKGDFEKGFITIFEEKGTIYIDTNINITVEDKESIVLLKNESLDPTLGNLVTMSFSNVFDVRYFDKINEEMKFDNPRLKDIPQVIDITTNELLSSYSNTGLLLDADSTNQIFFSNKYLEALEIGKILDLPNKINIKNGEPNKNLMQMSESFENFIDNFSAEDVSKMHFNFISNNKFINTLALNILQGYCFEVAKILIKYPELDENMVVDAYNYGSNKGNTIEIIHKELINVISFTDPHNVKKINYKLKKVSLKFRTLLKLVRGLEINEDINESFYLTNDTATSEFIEYYRENFYSQGLIRLHWSDMSSGQLGLLNLFGRFYNALHEVEEDLLSDLEEYDYKSNSGYDNTSDSYTIPERLKNYTYLLLLDECDLYFHPQWQKDWLYYFLKLIEILFKGNVQVILTTHSPFILSDFPNSNVTFLSKSSVLKNDLEGSVRTFGANINELFTNSFFINDGLMGKFSKNKINNFIKDFLNTSPNDIEENKEKYKKFIDLIGEPLIKNKLLQIYNEKIILASNNSIENRIKYLESELNKIKKRSGSNN